jgi:hypothetical protein
VQPPTTDRYQYPSSAFNFGGSNQHINLGNSSVLKPTSELTVSVWFELNNAGTLTGRSMISNTENGGYNLQYIHSGQTIRGNVWRNGSYAVLTAPAAAISIPVGIRLYLPLMAVTLNYSSMVF